MPDVSYLAFLKKVRDMYLELGTLVRVSVNVRIRC